MALVKCHECGHEISTSAESCPNCGAKRKKSLGQKEVGCGALLLVVIGFAVIASLFDDGDEQRTRPTSTPSSSPSRSVGSDVVLRVNNGDVVVCTSKDAYDEFLQLAVAKDYLGMSQMEAAGRLFRVPSGTKARVIGTGFEKREVRIMDGENFGRSGWVTSSLVQ